FSVSMRGLITPSMLAGQCQRLFPLKRFLGGSVAVAALVWVASLPASNAIFTVSNTNDSGPGSLRQAILDANATNGPNTIAFQIQAPSGLTITPLSALPPISVPVLIDGRTQPGFSNQPIVEINGSAAGNNAGFRLLAGSST